MSVTTFTWETFIDIKKKKPLIHQSVRSWVTLSLTLRTLNKLEEKDKW